MLLDEYVTPLSASDLLTNAYKGASGMLDSAGVSGSGPAPEITDQTPDGAWAQFLPAYQQLEGLAGSDDQRILAYAAVNGMYDPLNCHTVFLEPKLYAIFYAEVEGNGIAEIGVTTRSFPGARDVIVRIAPGSPADVGGLTPGDRIVAIDHKTRADAGWQYGDLLYDEAGRSLTLTIERPGTADPFDVTLTRQLVPADIEQHRVLAGGIGYLQLDSFPSGPETNDRVSKALADFQAAGVSGWILDLRDNGGGSAVTADEIAGQFVGAGNLVGTERTQDGTVETDRSLGGAAAGQMPMVVLVGPRTASAGEILPQTLKDLRRATLVGEKTAGCVDGGHLDGLLDGSGAFVSTFDLRAGPNKVSLEGVGVSPDMPAPLSRDDVVNGTDPQLDAAVSLLTGPTSAAP